MKVNQNKNNQILKKLCAKSFINSKKDEKIFSNSNKKTEKRYLLKNSSSSKNNLKKYETNKKCNILKDNSHIKNMISQNILKANQYINNSKNNKKRSVILNKVNLNKRIEKEKEKNHERQNKIFELLNNKNNESNSKSNNIYKKNILNNYKNSVGHNKTINHIRIKNQKLNSVLYNNNENKNINNKTFNFCLPIRNYKSLNKDNSMNRSLNYSINKEDKRENMKRLNNSFRIKENSKLKIKLKNNKSIEKEYFNFSKVINNSKKHGLNKTLVQNYTCPLNTSGELSYNTERNNRINTISSSFQISLNSKDKEIKNNINESKSRKKNSNFLKSQLDNLKSNSLNEVKTGKEINKTIKEKLKTTFLPASSKSNHKRKKINKKEPENAIKKKIYKKNKIIRRRNEKINNHYNSEIIYKEETKNSNKLIKIINNNIKNKENNKTNDNDNIVIINDNYNTLPNNNLTISDIFDSNINKTNNSIFEVISNVKVKSFVEYEEDKKNLLNIDEKNNNKKDNGSDNFIKEINSNININEILDGSNMHHKSIISIISDSDEKKEKENFIEDRDEYNVILKENFSKDRFSFRPTNNDSNETFKDPNIQVLDKKDFLNNKDISFSKFEINNNLKKKIPFKKKNKQVKNDGSNIEKINKLIKGKSKEMKNKK